MSQYTHAISYYKKVDGLGWVFQSYKTTEDALRPHLRALIRQRKAGTVRTLQAVRVK